MEITLGNVVMFGLIAFYIAWFWDGHVRYQAKLKELAQNKNQEAKE